ncbi:Dolichyl-phosphate-mannose-protein mannosyltransferase [Atopostipes suicloacalis DSM 15692]|uniref:Dolichyl-phosphate-mannose-protein mannosyltransferase n=1 Tax=Atopostipes suicloacalis DSM 15692 TaxID=1121025 RepID=A0A1M4SW39_9LACT|nr:glycosyltransferase family 39 protein [Atopostipes suicloacalis]SHE36415.1 Dolichyl-phosphate-mannose-protein mannosyltransferase [Atopostipes suicloacalis DSM 15692]
MFATWIVFIIQALLSHLFFAYLGIEGLPVLIVLITTIFFIFDLSQYDFPKEVFLILFLTYFLRLFLLFFDLYGRDYFVLPNSGLDSEMFNQSAITGLATGNYGNGHVYSVVIGFLYSFFGFERIIPQFFNVLLSIQAIIFIYKTMGLYKIQKKAKYFALTLIAILPNFAIMSSILLRESIIIFLYALSFYCFSKWLIDKNLLWLTLAYVCGLLVSVFHSGSIILVVAYTLILILFDRRKDKFRISYQSVLLAIAFGFVFIYLFQNYYDLFFAKFSNINEVDDVVDIYVMGESGYSTGYAIKNPILNFIVNTPVRMFYFIFSPLPWTWRGITDVIAFLFSGLFYGYTLYLGVRHLFHKNVQNKNFLLIILLIVLGGIMVFSWGVSNAGTALRHRDKFIGLFILLLAITMNETKFVQAKP